MSPSLIYTLGRRAVYDPYIASDLSAAKAKGGSVWRTWGEAEFHRRAYSLDDFRVYGVVADWERDTEEDGEPLGRWRALTKDAYLIDLS